MLLLTCPEDSQRHQLETNAIILKLTTTTVPVTNPYYVAISDEAYSSEDAQRHSEESREQEEQRNRLSVWTQEEIARQQVQKLYFQSF